MRIRCTHLKKALPVLVGLALALSSIAQTELKVNGRALKKPDGSSIVLRGVNSGLGEDGNYDLSDLNACKAYIDQIAMSGANAIRFTWYTDGVSWRDGGQYIQGDPQPEARYHKGNGTTMSDYISNGNLSAIFAYCKTKNIIPVLAIHDLTCSNDWAYFNSDLKTWWTKPAVISLINAHKDHIILNLANEMGKVRWNGGNASDYTTFKTNYGTLITALRTAGVKVPVMIDGPDCGQSITELMDMSADLLMADPEHNIIFSSHLYWYGYAVTANEIAAKLNESVTANVCLALGEIANKQDVNGCGDTDISAVYQEALTQACPLNINWFAWSWDQDCQPARNMTTNGNYNTLTTFGSDIVNNATYGLKSANCGAQPIATTIKETNATQNNFMQWRNDIAAMHFLQSGSYTVYNIHGQLMQQGQATANNAVSLQQLATGMYVVSFTNSSNEQQTVRIVR